MEDDREQGNGIACSFLCAFVIFSHYFIAYSIHVVIILTAEVWSQICLPLIG